GRDAPPPSPSRERATPTGTRASCCGACRSRRRPPPRPAEEWWSEPWPSAGSPEPGAVPPGRDPRAPVRARSPATTAASASTIPSIREAPRDEGRQLRDRQLSRRGPRPGGAVGEQRPGRREHETREGTERPHAERHDALGTRRERHLEQSAKIVERG